MIAVSSKGHSFRAFAAYLAAGRGGGAPERVAWSTGRNLPTDDPALAAKLMRATADANHRVEKPVYHLVISFDRQDHVDRTVMEQTADKILAHIGLREHQAIIVAHRDREHPHMHILVNRIHPETLKAWKLDFDYHAIQRILRTMEQDLGVEATPGTLGHLPEQTIPERPDLTAREWRQQQRGTIPFVERVRVHAQDFREATSWEALDTRLQQHGFRLQPATGHPGLVVTDGTHYVKASHIARDLSLRSLERRYGVLHAEHRADPSSPVTAITRDLRRLAYVHELTMKQYDAEVATTATRTTLDRAQWGVTLRERTSTALTEAFTRVYRHPAAAQVAFHDAADRGGTALAIRTLHDHPDRFGALRTVQEARFGGLIHTQSDAIARREVPQAVRAAYEWSAAHTHSRDDVHAVQQRLALTERELTVRRTELSGLPSARQLERAIAFGARRLLPEELARLESAVTAPHRTLLKTVREKLRDLALGKEGDERER